MLLLERNNFEKFLKLRKYEKINEKGEVFFKKKLVII